MVGSENETAIADVIREFLPNRYGVEVNALVIDRHGACSKQCDIVIYDHTMYPRYFRKVFPVELVYATIEVKTCMRKTEANRAIENITSLSLLDFRPELTCYWQNKTTKENIHHSPPALFVFAYRTDAESFETFARWFPREIITRGIPLREKAPKFPEVRTLAVCALDQGIIDMESSNAYVTRFVTTACDDACPRTFRSSVAGNVVQIDPTKALFLFLEGLWTKVSTHEMHPGFDIRSYASNSMDRVIEAPDPFENN